MSPNHYELHLTLIVLLIAYGIMARFKLLPTVEALHDFGSLFDTKGGIILGLSCLSLIFFFAGMRWLYWSTMLVVDKRLGADNALVLNGFNWISGAAFMGAFGALLNAMKGDTAVKNSSTVVTSSNTTEEPKL